MSNLSIREYQPVKFSDDESQVTVGAETFRATAGPLGRCDGCAMKNGFGCDLVRRNDGPRCQPDKRKDGRSIVWKGTEPCSA
jgi:hypothetical protein